MVKGKTQCDFYPLTICDLMNLANISRVDQPALWMGVRQANAQKARVAATKLKEKKYIHYIFTQDIIHYWLLCSTHSNNLSLGNGGSNAPHKQRAGPVKRSRSGRVIFRLLFLFLLLFSVFLWFLLFTITWGKARY